MKKKDYLDVYRNAKTLKYISLEARDLAIRSGLELYLTLTESSRHSMKTSMGRVEGLPFPYIEPCSEGWNTYVEQNLEKEYTIYDSDWSRLYQLSSQEGEAVNKASRDPVESDIYHGRARIYDNMLKISEMLEFSKKDYYQSSCYWHYLVAGLNHIESRMQWYTSAKGDERKVIEDGVRCYFKGIENQIALIDKRTNMELPEIFFTQSQERFSESIAYIHDKSRDIHDEEGRKYILEILTRLVKNKALLKRKE